MPISISFMQGFNLHRVNEFDVTGRWENNSSPRSLAAPIGTGQKLKAMLYTWVLMGLRQAQQEAVRVKCLLHGCYLYIAGVVSNLDDASAIVRCLRLFKEATEKTALSALHILDYVGMFTDIARIGRSLGMYMVLTMQSPQGVIKGQVKANIMNRCRRFTQKLLTRRIQIR